VLLQWTKLAVAKYTSMHTLGSGLVPRPKQLQCRSTWETGSDLQWGCLCSMACYWLNVILAG